MMLLKCTQHGREHLHNKYMSRRKRSAPGTSSAVSSLNVIMAGGSSLSVRGSGRCLTHARLQLPAGGRREASAADNTLIDYTANLTDDVIGFIFFSSGFISTYWRSLLACCLVNKRICKLGQRCIFRVSAEANSQCHSAWLCHTLPQMVYNLSVLKLDYTFPSEGDFPTEFGERAACMAKSLTLLSCRGTALHDAALQSICKHLPALAFLDISKSSRALAHLITDVGGEGLSGLRNLGWLNLSMTRITDRTIAVLTDHAQTLRHLGLECCTLLTDACFGSLERMRLETLDVSSCALLTNDGFFRLGNKKSLCRVSLKHLLMSYLPLVTFDMVTFLLAMFNGLTMLEMKSRLGLSEGALPIDRRVAAQAKLQAAIFVHGDESRDHTVPSMYAKEVCRAYGL